MKKSIKLLIVTNILTPYTIARYTAISKMNGIELSVLIQAKSEPNRTWNFYEYDNLNFSCNLLPGFNLKLGKKESSNFHINYKVKKNILKNKPDVVIIVGWNNPASYLAARICKKNNIPLIAWSGSTKNEPSLFRTLGVPAIKWLHRQCSAFVAYGTAAKELLVDYWGIDEKKIFILGNPVDNAFFSKESQKAKEHKIIVHDVFKNKKIILFIGQLVKRKGILDLIVAFEYISKKHPDAHLVIAGKGNLKKKLTNYINQIRPNNIHLIGHYNQNDLPKLYAHSTLFCLPSREEVWGLVINEAMACGIPVVASDVCGACKDLILPGKTGLIFKTSDTNDLARQLLALLDNKFLYQRIKSQSMAHIAAWEIKRLQKNLLKAVSFVLIKKNQ